MLVNKTTGEIFVYDAIGADWFGGGITASAVIEALDLIGNKRATVRINSPGGVADEGIAIYNALRRHKAGVDTVVDSLAASAASLVAIAGENRTIAKGGRVMVHRALTVAVGNSVEMQKIASILDTYDRSLVEIYSQYFPKDTDVMGLMTEETWYTAEEAVAAGLATGLEAKDAIEPNVAAWFRRPPSNLGGKFPAKSFAVKRQAAEIRNRLFL